MQSGQYVQPDARVSAYAAEVTDKDWVESLVPRYGFTITNHFYGTFDDEANRRSLTRPFTITISFIQFLAI